MPCTCVPSWPLAGAHSMGWLQADNEMVGQWVVLASLTLSWSGLGSFTQREEQESATTNAGVLNLGVRHLLGRPSNGTGSSLVLFRT